MSSPLQLTATTHLTLDAPLIKPPDIPHSTLPSPPTSPILLLSGNASATTRIRLKTPKAPKTAVTVASQNESWNDDVMQSASPSLTSFAVAVARREEHGHSTMTPASAGVKAKRRQSSIAYFTPSSPSPWERIEGQKHRRSLTRAGPSSVSSPPSRGRMLEGDGPRVSLNAGRMGGKRESLVMNDLPNSNRESLEEVGAKEREPLTLVEKHADLLHFIAQKERKCLELREQLAVHEKELADLKRRWERIVNRSVVAGGGGYDNPVSVSSTNVALGGLALDGFKEGVRKIAAGLTDLGATSSAVSDPLQRPAKPRTATHSQHESDSSVSVSADTSSGLSNWRISTSSVSSFCEGEGAGGGAGAVDDVRSSSMDAAPSGRRSASLHRRTTRSRSREGSTDSTNLRHKSAEQRTDGMMHGSASDISHPTGPQTALSSRQTSNPPPSAFKHTALPTNLSSASPRPLPTPSTRDVKYSRRTSLATAFPPASSVPGLGSFAMGPSVGGPVSSWIGSVGKKFQSAETLSKSQKRASVLFADVSQSIMSALSDSVSPSPSSSTSSLRTPLSASTNIARTNDLLDDDDGDDTVRMGHVMVPDAVKLAVVPAATLTDDVSRGTGTQKAVSSKFDDDDNWNW